VTGRRAGAAGLALGLALLAAAARLGAQSRTAVDDFTGPSGSSKPFLATTPRGGLLLSWFEPRGEKRWALRIAARDSSAWTAPATVVEGDRLFVNWADFPSAQETADGDWVVHWLEKAEAKPYAYHVRLSFSRDRGRTWSAPLTAHRDRSPTEHGFVAMVPRTDGSIDLAWLDGGRMAIDSAGSMELRAANWRPDGPVQGEIVLDGRTCECCHVAMARTAAGLVAVYRDRSADEVRDIALVRELGGRWSGPTLVHRDGWSIRACPVNGPDVAARDQEVAVAWYTAANGAPRVKAALSADGGGMFGSPVTVDDGNPLGRVQVALAGPGEAVVVWLEAAGEEAEWRIRWVTRAGGPGRAGVVGATARTREAGFARAALLGYDLFVAWSEPGPHGRVRVSRYPLATLPRR
jgi:hypothetical protein